MDIVCRDSGFEAIAKLAIEKPRDELNRAVRLRLISGEMPSHPCLVLSRSAASALPELLATNKNLAVLALAAKPLQPLGAKAIIQVGAHSPGLGNYPMRQISQDGLADVCDLAMAKCREYPGFIIMLDMGVVDPAFVPGADDPMPGGLTSRELIYALQRFSLLHNCKGAVIGGFDPQDPMAAKLCAKAVVELANLGVAIGGGG